MEYLSRQRAQGRSGTEPPQRSFSAFSTAPRSTFSNLRDRDDTKDLGNTPPRAMGSWKTTGPAANARPANSSVMAGRKLFNRNQNPSRTGVGATRSFSDAPMNTPGRVFASTSFKTGLANGNKFTFSPRVPHNTARESFPAVTPGRSFRGASADMSGRTMSKGNTSNLFQMRITSPPPELSGEALTKQVPENGNRVGSIYADEFLSHLVPPELDDLQRRQFLCILDLRRLKYASNEIFLKKDWRVNILNFAKEYEKSRSLIMLRYGLYEFKTVPASRELLKKWKAENDVPDEDQEMVDDSTPKSQASMRGSTKRRAEDDLPKGSESQKTSSPFKRRASEREPFAESIAPASNANAGATPFPRKTKRGLDEMDQDEENQPSKMQKSKPSATLSLFEEVANNTPAKRIASPPKPASKPISKPLFGDATASKPQPSIFAQPSAKPATSGGNIFGHLSQGNTPMGSDDDDDNSQDEDDSDVEEVAAPAKKASDTAPTFGTPGSTLFGNKPSTPFGGSTTPGNLFGNGSSLMNRASGDAEPQKAAEKQPTSPPKQTQPQDKTWNPNTPIKFGGTQGGSVFGQSSATTPAFGTQVKDFATETPKASAPSLFNQAEKPSGAGSTLFGNSSKPSLFGNAEQQKPSEPSAPSSLFGSKPQDASTTPFGKSSETPVTDAQSKSVFGGLSTPTPSSQAPPMFGTTTDKPASNLFGTAGTSSTSLFGAANANKSAPAAPLFGASISTEEPKEESAAKRKKPDSDTTGENGNVKFSFGGGSAVAAPLPPKTEAAAKGATDATSVFGGAPSVGEKKFTFGAPATTPAVEATPAAAPSFLFGNTTATPAEPVKTATPTSLFGNAPAEPAKTPSLFANPTPSAPTTGFSFGTQSTTPANPAPNTGFSFGTQGTQSTAAANPPSAGLFGASSNDNTNASQGSLFGSATNAAPAPAETSFKFNADPVVFNSVPSLDFGASSGGFQFGAGGTPATTSSSQFSFGGAPAAAAPTPTSGFSFGGASQPAAPANGMFGGAAPDAAPSMFNFGSGSQEQSQPASGLFSGQPANAAQGIFASNLAAPPTASGASK